MFSFSGKKKKKKISTHLVKEEEKAADVGKNRKALIRLMFTGNVSS